MIARPIAIVLAALLALVMALAGIQSVRLSHAQMDLAKERTARADETAERERVAINAVQERMAAAVTHAQRQQELTDGFEKQIAALTAARTADAATAGRLRDKLAAFTAGGRSAGETDAAAAVRAFDRLGAVGSLLGESVDLVVEGRQIIERRDAEVKRLMQQIETDRAACSN